MVSGVTFGHCRSSRRCRSSAPSCFVVGALVGFPALRVKGLYLALVTLGLAVIFPDLATRFVKGTGGTSLVALTPTSSRRRVGADGFVRARTSGRITMAFVVRVIGLARRVG